MAKIVITFQLPSIVPYFVGHSTNFAQSSVSSSDDVVVMSDFTILTESLRKKKCVWHLKEVGFSPVSWSLIKA